MNRKLLALNLALIVVAAYAGIQLRRQWQASKTREAARLNVGVKALPAPKYQPIEPQPPVVATGYADIATKMLFDRSRNPTLVIEPPPPPPPPPPMPPLPVYHGMMNIDGPTAILSLGTGQQQAIRPGERIGQFTLVDVNTDGIAFDWNGETVRKSVDELTRPATAAAQPAPEARTDAPAPVQPPQPVMSGPGEDTGRGFKTCTVADGLAEGTVKDGYRKVGYATPFGQACRWEPVGK